MNENNSASQLMKRFLLAVQASYAKYTEHGARSNQKLRPLHQWIADEMQRALGCGYVIRSLRSESSGREEKIQGKYYDKFVDVSISREEGLPLASISVKFITSNFKQNANNYFEHLMGETANIRRKDVIFGHFMVLPKEIPYLNRKGEIIRTETVGDHHLQKYVNLECDDDYPHRPEVIGIGLISLPLGKLENANEITLVDPTEMKISQQIKTALAGKLSVPSFIQKINRLIVKK